VPSSALSASEGRVDAAAGLGFLVVAVAMGVLLDAQRPAAALPMVALVLAFAALSRVQFEVGAGYTVPTQLVFWPLLLLAPTPLAPLLVAAGLLLARLPDYARGRIHVQRAVLCLADSWFAVGPALLLTLAGAQTPDWADLPIYVLALLSQFAVDLAVGLARERYALGIAPRLQVGLLAWVYAVDGLLAPVGLAAAFAAGEDVYGFLLVLPLAALLRMFARERRVRLDNALELSQAYRGTALLLGDVIEADDEYTGSHSRDVVELSIAVADRMGLDARQRRDVEFAALLHDVGKIRISDDIINKPGPLTPRERAVIDRHTLEGQEMLESVGGVLAGIGRIVRSCHEHYDGGGYPDGLAGEAIPVEARIVGCCDAFSAMTTTRAYRQALPHDAAMRELRRHAGAQFDPAVVDVLLEIVGRDASRARRDGRSAA